MSPDLPLPQNDDDLRLRKLERCILAGAVFGPLILGLWSYYQRSGSFSPSVHDWILTYVGTYTEAIAMQMLTIWLALRYPTLGGRPLRSMCIVLVLLSALAAAEYLPNSVWFSTTEPVMQFMMLIGRPLSLLLSVVALVLARRIFKIVLVKQHEPQDYQPTRLSIRELMIWTLVIAGFFGLHQQLRRWMQSSQPENFIDAPGWLVIVGALAQLAPALLVVVIIRLQPIPLWKWFPPVTIAYTAWHLGYGQLNIVFYQSRLGFSGPALSSRVVTAVVAVSIAAFVVWMYQKIGFRFLHARGTGPLLAA